MKKLTERDQAQVQKLNNLLKQKYGDLIERIYVFGSRLTEHKKDADFDILVVTSKKINWRKEREIFSVVYNYGLDTQNIFDIKIFSKEEFDIIYNRMPFIRNVKANGFVL